MYQGLKSRKTDRDVHGLYFYISIDSETVNAQIQLLNEGKGTLRLHPYLNKAEPAFVPAICVPTCIETFSFN
jgi:hypothetical protein